MKSLTYLLFWLFALSSPVAANTWQGTISHDWNTPGNWSDNAVPDETVDVIIQDVAADPIIDIGPAAECRDLNTAVGSYLTISDNLTVHGDMNVNGQIYIPNLDSVYVYGDVDWRAGSSAIISSWSNFYVYGDWLFHSGSDVQITNGVVRFAGDQSSLIYSHEANSHFYSLRINKTDGAQVAIADSSTEDLHISNDLQIFADAYFYTNAPLAMAVNGDFTNFIGGDFDFDNGTVVMTGALPELNCNGGRFYNLTIQSTGSTQLRSDLTLDGSLVIDSGALDALGYDIEIKGDWTNNSGTGTFVGDYGTVTFRGSDSTISAAGYEIFNNLAVSGFVSPPAAAAVTIAEDNTVFVENDVDVNYQGTINVAQGAKLKAENRIHVNFGGLLSAVGAAGSYAYVGGPGENYGRPAVTVDSGGTIAAEYVIFEYLDAGGVNVPSGGIISALHPFTDCMFRYGAAGGTMMTVDNTQDVTLDGVQFSENTWGGRYNITKNTDQGQVWLTHCTGPFAGPRHEKDPHHRILWGDGPHDWSSASSSLQLLLLAD